MYVYQRPELAWDFVKAREITEGRNIPMDEFVRQYLAVRRNIAELRRCYDVNVYVDLLIKNTDGSDESYEEGVSAEQIDAMLPETYDQIELTERLTEADRNDCS
ncbi:Zeta toxin [compost metagenome]